MPQQTHDLRVDGDAVTKVYRSWDRGEPDREWAALSWLHDHAPGLAASPLERTEVDGRPAVVMSRLPGTPLGETPLSETECEALCRARCRLHEVPVTALPPVLSERISGPPGFWATVAQWLPDQVDLTACRDHRLVHEAVLAAREWLATPLAAPPSERVLGMADGNLANALWDGEVCRLVDFEDAGGSSLGYEVADQVEHLSFRLAEGDPEAVVRRLAPSPAEQAAVTAYRPLFACFWVMMLLPGHPGFARNPAGTTEGAARHLLELLAT